MPITVQCVCGKRTGVSDALAGKVIRCPACGDAVVVTGKAVAAAPGGGGTAVKTRTAAAKTQQASPKIDISHGQKVAICVIGALLVIGGAFFFGPMRVWRQWDDLEPKASTDVQSLVIFSLKQHMKEDEDFMDPMARRRQPSVERGDVHFFQPILAFTMPDKIAFMGKSNQGTFTGHYFTQTHVVDATVSYGGMSVAGMVDLAKAKGTLHLVGHMVNDRQPDMEIDGKKVQWN